LAEFLGTFYLCFAGISAILCNTPAVGGMSGLLGIALAHGLALSIAVNVFGGGVRRACQSGGHRRHLSAHRAGLAGAYIVAQCLGARPRPGFLLRIFHPKRSPSPTGIPLPAPWASARRS
jgi:hypothetical protein